MKQKKWMCKKRLTRVMMLHAQASIIHDWGGEEEEELGREPRRKEREEETRQKIGGERKEVQEDKRETR